MTDTAALQAMIDSGQTIPPGVYHCTEPLIQPIGGFVRGSGWNQTIIMLDANLGPAPFFGLPAGFDTAHRATHFEGFSLRSAVPTAPTHGLELGPAASMNRVDIRDFRGGAGVRIRYDHNLITGCKVNNCRDNLSFAAGNASIGNHTIIGCQIELAARSNIHISALNRWDTVVVQSTHFGWSPYGILKEDDPDGTPGGYMMTNSVIRNCAFEQIGNAAILDRSTGVKPAVEDIWSFLHCEIERCYFSWGAAYRLASEPRDYAVSVRAATATRVIEGLHPFEAGDIAAYQVGSGVLQIDGVWRPTITRPSAPCITLPGLVAMHAAEPLAAGDLVQHNGSGNTVRRRLAGSTAPVMVATNAVTLAGDTVWVVRTRGTAVPLTVDGGATTASGQLLYPSVTVPHHAQLAPNGAYAPIACTDWPGGFYLI